MKVLVVLTGFCLYLALANAAFDPADGQDSIMKMLQGAVQQNNSEMDNLVSKQQAETSRYQDAIANPTGNAIKKFQGGDDLAASLASMLEEEKRSNQEHIKNIMLEQKHHEAVNRQISEQRKKIHDRSVFLERLNVCINQGPSTQNMEVEINNLEKQKQSFLQKTIALDSKIHNMAKEEAVLLAKEEIEFKLDSDLRKTADIEKKVHNILKEGAGKVKSQLNDISANEMDIQNRVDMLNAREQAIETQSKRLDMLMGNVKEQHMRFVEINSKNDEIVSAANTTSAVNSDPAAAADAACSKLKTCDDCANKGSACGWCQDFNAPSSTGRCYSHNVNAVSDGLTSGRCKSDQWYSRVSDRITTLTMNVYGADEAQKEFRLPALWGTIIAAKFPDIIAFQEMSPWLLEELMKQPWANKYYNFAEVNKQVVNDGMMILSRFTIRETVLIDQKTPTDAAADARPRYLASSITIADKPVTIATVHLDWRKGETRANALNLIAQTTGRDESIILLGDFNFDDGAEPETKSVPANLTDMWLKIHPSEKMDFVRGPNFQGYTWDPATNWYAKYSDTNSRPSRVDRTYIRSPYLLPRSIWLVGCPGPDYLCVEKTDDTKVTAMIPFQNRLNQVASKLVYPSPHYGLLSEFSVFTPHC